ncbi:MAG: type II toxin-antitoxin system RelE/ParE family toxin [Candidatus Micrarchaeia archaeon]|jgi:mRNA-degrading endonuclease YafQ of YafQ-DinJ toxin-antitoxin module
MHEVRYSAAFDKDFGKLKIRAKKGNAEAKKLLSLIDDAVKKLSSDREAGRKIPRTLWPGEYVQKYDVTNLWKYNLDSYWRLIYTITGTEIEMFLICLDFMPHPDYDRKFGYG